MKYRDLQIQTQREFPSNMRTPGFGWLVRAGYITREKGSLPLGDQAVGRLRALKNQPSFFSRLALPVIANQQETFFPISTGAVEVAHCPSCGYTSRRETAQFKKIPFPSETRLPVEKILTPDCNTIESLARYLGLPEEKTAKALMFTRLGDHQFVLVVVRGDMQLSEAKLRKLVGEVRIATTEEMIRSGAAAGFASPIGLKNALIVADDLIPESTNLVAGANDAGYHLKNTNYGRDYTAEIVADVVMANPGYRCSNCGNKLELLNTESLAEAGDYHLEKILHALAETHHDDKGLTFPIDAAPFQVYLMHVPGTEMDTRAKAEEIYGALQGANISVLFDDRHERAGVKFNDADLIGCPIRVTVGEKNLKQGMVELKPRKEKENKLIQTEKIIEAIKYLS
ncbi:MAG TPA: YbaK/EbsC family protein [Anaerolineales bacterium]|nr:YbaK/EbsC family protein [Anaerolineales bacterium]